jgi:hypothetical protein
VNWTACGAHGAASFAAGDVGTEGVPASCGERPVSRGDQRRCVRRRSREARGRRERRRRGRGPRHGGDNDWTPLGFGARSVTVSGARWSWSKRASSGGRRRRSLYTTHTWSDVAPPLASAPERALRRICYPGCCENHHGASLTQGLGVLSPEPLFLFAAAHAYRPTASASVGPNSAPTRPRPSHRIDVAKKGRIRGPKKIAAWWAKRVGSG